MDIIDDKYTKKGTWIKDGVLMCNKDCCGAPVSECSCDSSCKKCNCYNLKEYGYSQPLTSIKPKGKKVKERDVVEAIPKSTMYGLVIDGEYVAKGSKADMRKLQKEKGGTVYNAPGKKVGDKAGVVKERYGMRGAPVAQSRKDINKVTNMNKRQQNKANDANRELNIKQASSVRRQNRQAKQIQTGIPIRAVQGQA